MPIPNFTRLGTLRIDTHFVEKVPFVVTEAVVRAFAAAGIEEPKQVVHIAPATH